MVPDGSHADVIPVVWNSQRWPISLEAIRPGLENFVLPSGELDSISRAPILKVPRHDLSAPAVRVSAYDTTLRSSLSTGYGRGRPIRHNTMD